MGALFAKQAEEKAELHAGRLRAKRFLERQSPSYMEDMDILATEDKGDKDDASTAYDGEVTETATQAESKSEAGDKSDAESSVGDATSDAGSQAEEKGDEMEATDPRERAKQRIKREYRQLMDAAAKGGFAGLWQVRYLLRKSYLRVDHKDAKGRSVMYIAAERGHPNVLDAAIVNRGKIDNSTNAKWTPLHAATFHGQMKCIEMLIEKNANLNAKDIHGCTPLILAASSPKLYIVDLVSGGDRRKRKKYRKGAVERQNKIDAGQSGKKWDIADPFSMWRYYPNRVELMVMAILLKDPMMIQVDATDNLRRTALTYAARYGRLYAISRLLAAKANPRHADAAGRTPLFHAAANGHLNAAEMFIRVGSSPNVTDQYFASPLHVVLENGDDPLANLLIQSEASVNCIDCEGRTPIMIAMDTKNHMMFGALVERRSNLDVLDKRGWNVVMYAVETDMLGEVLPLLAKSGEAVKGILRLFDPQGRNSLHHAAFTENTVQATAALDALIKLDPDAAKIGDCNGDTPVHVAGEMGRLDMLRMMGSRLGTLNFLNHRGETPLMYAAHGGHMASFIALVEDRGMGPLCDAGMVDEDGKTVLMHACASGHLDLVNLILQNREGRHPDLALPRLDVNQADCHGITALHVAASEGYWQLLPSLVLAGSNKASKDKDGCTALHAAAIEDEVLAVSTLLDIGLDPDVGDMQGWTALMHAVWKGADDTVRILLDHQAALDARNFDGDTALQVGLRRKDEDVKRTLDLLTDGLLDRDYNTTHAVEAAGHFMITVASASDLYHEGKADQINSYVYLELCPKTGDSAQIGYTSCILGEASPEWNEVFRFDVEKLDPSAYLIAWVISAPGEEAQEVIDGAHYSLTEDQLEQMAMQRALAGLSANPKKPDFNTALAKSLNRQTHREDRDDDMAVRKAGTIARLPKPPAPSTYQRSHIPLIERRQNDMTNMRQLLQKSGVNIQEPLIPRTHMALGCVVARFRHLRAAVWGCEPLVMDRTMRMNCKGDLTFEIDFRPRYFKAIDPLGKIDDKDDEGPRTPRAEDLDETAETALAAPPPKIEHNFMFSSAGGVGIQKGREYMAKNPVELYTKYKHVSHWASEIVTARNKLVGEEYMSMTEASHESVGYFKKQYQAYQAKYAKYKDENEKRKNGMDKEVTAIAVPKIASKAPITAGGGPGGKKGGGKGGKGKKGKGKGQTSVMKLPQLKVEPWLEEILDGSRFW